MNDDYLWDKSGADPETLRLEEALAVFRYRETEPPVLPAAADTTRRRTPFAFAVPAFAVLTLAAGLWFGLVKDHEDYEVTFVHHPATETKVQPTNNIEPHPTPPASVKEPVRRTRREALPTIASARRRSRAKAGQPKTTTVATLTNEERHAYEQLMLALAISSSKIKVVHNAINGIEENENLRTPNNR